MIKKEQVYCFLKWNREHGVTNRYLREFGMNNNEDSSEGDN